MSATHTPGPCPAMSPRLPDDPRLPQGMLESDRDFIGHNSAWLEWCEANARLIAAAPDLLTALKSLRSIQDEKPPLMDSSSHTDYCLRLIAAEEQADAAIQKATAL